MDWLEKRVEGLILRYKGSIDKGDWERMPLHLGYEQGEYREGELKNIIRDALPHFALTPEEYKEYTESGDDGEKQRLAWSRISKRNKNNKGDYGELLLFLILKVFYKSDKLVTKVKLKTSDMLEVNGYDCAHFTIEDEKPVLWLGEAKFYKSFSNAISEAFKSVKDHCTKKFTVESEFSFLEPNIEVNKDNPYYMDLRSILKKINSFDEINIKVPIFITYECKELNNHTSNTTDDFIKAFKKEFNDKYQKMDSKAFKPLSNFEFIFILLPFKSVSEIKDQIDILEKVNR